MSNEASLRAIARNLTMEFFPCSLAVGKVVKHPDGRTVKITSGQYLDPVYGRLSNFWYWREVKASGELSKKEECGYGW